jgi:putative hydrolase of the HAD superfamily
MHKRFRLIIFDLGNTIIRFDHHISARKISSRFGLDEAAVYGTLFDSELTRLFDAGKVSAGQFHSGMTRELGIQLPYAEFVEIWSDIFWEDAESCALARRLAHRYALCLMSNVNELHFEHIRKKFDVVKVFDYIVLSYVVGVLKPDRRIFEHARSRSGVDFSGMLYIDDREDLVEAARSFGIEALKFQGAPALESWLLERKVL